MNRGKKILINAAIVILIICPEVYSQNSRVVYFMSVPQNHLLNPAIKPATLFYIGLPAVSGAYAGFGNNFIAISDIVVPGLKSDKIFTFQDPNFDLSSLADKLKNSNTITSEASLQLLG